MLSQQLKDEAVKLAQFVVENGRVESKGGKFIPASMEEEVSFEASERGYDARTAQQMGRFAAKGK